MQRYSVGFFRLTDDQIDDCWLKMYKYLLLLVYTLCVRVCAYVVCLHSMHAYACM